MFTATISCGYYCKHNHTIHKNIQNTVRQILVQFTAKIMANSLIYLFLMIFATLHFGDAKPVSEDRTKEIPENNQPRYLSNVPCCFMTKCEEINIEAENHAAFQCYQQKVCGSSCSMGRRRT